MAQYDKRPTQETSEPDLLDFLAQWTPLIFDMLSTAEVRPAPSEPVGARRLIAVEQAVLRLEAAQQRRETLCANIAGCAHHRCRRRKRCSMLEKIAATLAEARAFTTAERARSRPPPEPDDFPRYRNKKGRTGVRP